MIRIGVLFATILLMMVSVNSAQAQQRSEAVLEIGWSDLLPPGETRYIAELQAQQSNIDHFGAATMPQIQTYNVVDELNGRTVRMGGYVLPFDLVGGRQVTRFLLVPYVGACIHVPPPPPNQLIYVETDEPIEITGLWDAVWIEGVMYTERFDNALGNTAYTMDLIDIRPYE